MVPTTTPLILTLDMATVVGILLCWTAGYIVGRMRK